MTTKVLRHRWWMLAALLCAYLIRGVASGQEPAQRSSLVIGSKNFTESRLLAEIMAQLIESRTTLEVERRPNLGGTTVAFAALKNGDVDLYPEYTGTGWAVLLGREDPVRDPLRAFLEVQRGFDREFDLAWLAPFGFSNSYALAVDATLADELDLKAISDLIPHQDRLRAAVSHEFLSRPDGFPGLTAAYGLEMANLRGMEHGLAYEAIRVREADLVDTYTTDGKLLGYDVRILEDDLHFFPPYDCAPVVRNDTLDRHPSLRAVLEELSFKIDADRMRQLNYQVEEEGGTFAAVASGFLVHEGLLGASEQAVGAADDRNSGFFAFLWSRRTQTLGFVGEHLFLTLVAVVLAIVFAVPMGIVLTRRRWLATPVLGLAGVIQTVPSLALLAFLIPVPGFGLGTRSAIAALFVYALLPIVRNTYTGIQSVDARLLEAARGIGMRDHEILWRVELPLATQTIMAGIRTSTVISIGVATLAAFVGAGGLGDPIVTGLQLNDSNLILSGAVPAAGLALAADFLLGRAERRLVPAGVT